MPLLMCLRILLFLGSVLSLMLEPAGSTIQGYFNMFVLTERVMQT